MAGRINAEDVATVKERSSIEDIVREHVTLRPAGIGTLKGLCPFHDEKTPSFNVRPAMGTYHCFGCGEGGDVISFVQQVEHLTFAETIERLAGKLGIELRYEDGGSGRRDEVGTGRRQRLLDAHRVAEEFYREVLVDMTRGDARAGRDFLRDRGFDGASAAQFGVGFAPRGGDDLARHLRGRGFTEDELTLAGLCARGSRGLYDKFRGRLLWPIRDITGSTVGFGARRLFDDDRMPAKYLNTAETPIYKKSQVLYGLDLAKKAIAADREAVIVEGYTDVMAAHLSGVKGAVATCGTAFGVDHIKILRRILRDEADQAPARVVFTFDGDAAGQKAAMKAFGEDQRWAAQSFVAVAPEGMDPCELRMARGPEAVKALVEDAQPMFEFAVRTTVARFDLDTAEGRIQAMRAAAPIIAAIRDNALRPEYIRTVAGWLGLDIDQLRTEVSRAARRASAPPAEGSGGPGARGERTAYPEPTAAEEEAALAAPSVTMPDLRDPIVRAERQLLQAILQYRTQFDVTTLEAIPSEAFTAAAHAAVFDGIRTVVGRAQALSSVAWITEVTETVALPVRALTQELSVAPLPTKLDPETGLPPQRYLDALVLGVHDAHLSRRIADATSVVRRLQHDPAGDADRLRAVTAELHTLEVTRARLREVLTP
ncbi:MAG: DNA primase [Dermatophilaceae bacterium]